MSAPPRRLLLRGLWAGLAALAAWPLLRFVFWREPAFRLVLFSAEELQGGGLLYRDEVFLLPDAGQEEAAPLALSARCSHLGCLVSFDAVRQEFRCPCHRSVYDRIGRRLAGPTETGLAHLEIAQLEDGGLAVQAPL